MNQYRKNRSTSFLKIRSRLSPIPSIFDGDEFAQKQITSYISLCDDLLPWRVKMEQPIQWITRDKNKAKKILIPKVWELTVAAIRFANAQKDEKLIDEVRKSKSHLQSISQVDLIIHSHKVIELAKANTEAFDNFGISAEFVSQTEVLLSDLESLIGKRRVLQNDKSIAAENFNVLTRNITLFLKNKLDWTMESYSEKAPDLVNHYFEARKLSKSPVRHIALRGLIIDAKSDEPIALGLVSVVETGAKTKVTAKGHFNFKQFPEGEFTLKIENLAYKPQLVTVRHYAEEHLYLTVKLETKPEPHPIQ